MWGFKNLRRPPSRPPPPFDPVVEAWLDSLPPPTAKPSLRELRQWRLSNYHGLGRGVFVTFLILRAVSCAIALSVVGIIASVVAGGGRFLDTGRLVPILVVCPVVALWNTAEFVTACLLRDGGILPTVHVAVDAILFLGVAIVMGTLLVDVICGLTDFGSTFDSAPAEIASVCLLIVLMVIHSFLLFFFICNRVDSSGKNTSPHGAPLTTTRCGGLVTPSPVPAAPDDKTNPLPTLAPFKLEPTATTLEVNPFSPTGHEPPTLGPAMQYQQQQYQLLEHEYYQHQHQQAAMQWTPAVPFASHQPPPLPTPIPPVLPPQAPPYPPESWHTAAEPPTHPALDPRIYEHTAISSPYHESQPDAMTGMHRYM